MQVDTCIYVTHLSRHVHHESTCVCVCIYIYIYIYIYILYVCMSGTGRSFYEWTSTSIVYQ